LYNKAEKGGVIMPRIIPIRDLKNTSEISRLCHETNEPIFITKNGYGGMVIMSAQIFEERMFMQDVYNKLAESESDVAAGNVKDAKKSLKRIREKHNV
jgi:PHD/YefM family antitoxin component YafN of YafNO toxin-antitoxin module